VASQLAVWRAGCIGVPLAESYPTEELAYVLEDCGARAVYAHPSFLAVLRPACERLGVPIIVVESIAQAGALEQAAAAAAEAEAAAATAAGADGAAADDEATVQARARADVRGTGAGAGTGALLIYTSGTTGRPKGVLVSMSALEAQLQALTSAWGWTPEDRVVNVLPLHHVHGIVAIQLSAAYMGAVVEMLPRFDAAATWQCLLREEPAAGAAGAAGAVTVFMAVPTVYARLVELFDKQPAEVQARWSARLRRAGSPLRLMVSGSAALPEPLALRWTQISGHVLLERYGVSALALAHATHAPHARAH